MDDLSDIAAVPKRYTVREELAALARFARQIERLSPAGRGWLGSYLDSLDRDAD